MFIHTETIHSVKKKKIETDDGIIYEIDDHGVIHQLDPKIIEYNIDYINTYSKPEYKQNSIALSMIRLSYLLGCIKSHPDSLLDVGYGSGAFMESAKKIIKSVDGFDITGLAVPPGCNKVESFPPAQHYNVITFWDVLEHIADINFVEFLPVDYLAISLPNCRLGTDIEWFSNWKHRKPNEHLHHFNLKSLSSFMSSKGYKLLDYSYIEDLIRIPANTNCSPNILTACFEKMKK